MEWITGSVKAAVLAVMQALLTDMGSMVMQALQKYLKTPMAMLQTWPAQQLIHFGFDLAVLVLPVAVVFQGLRISVRSSEGSLDVDIGTIVRRCILAALALFGNYVLFTWLAQFADNLIQAFLNAGTDITAIEVLFSMSTGISFSGVILGLVLVGGWFLLAIQRAVLGLAFVFYAAIGPLCAVSIAHQDTPVLWNTWMREVTALCLTYVLQTAYLWLFLASIGTMDSLDSFFMAVGAVIAMYSAPKLVRDLTYNSGAGAAVVGGGGSASRMAVNYAMMRSLHTAILPGAK